MKPKHLLNYLLICTMILLSYSSCKKKSGSDQAQGNQSTITKEIPGLATVTFPVGSIQTTTPFLLQAVDTAEESCFSVTADLFRVISHLPYQIKINIGKSPALSNGVTIRWTVPDEFMQSLPDSGKVVLFARMYQDGGEEILDNYMGLEGTFDALSSIFTATLPYFVFSDKLTTDASYEAILILGANIQMNHIKYMNSGPCRGDNIQCPAGSCDSSEISSPFAIRLDPIGQKVYKQHTGIDLKVDQGSDVRASAAGVVVRRQLNNKPGPDGKPRGYGMYLVILHYDGSSTLYGHLSETDVKEGDIVERGQVIAKSGGRKGDLWSGGSTGPHLHFEYVPSGEIIGSSNYANPVPCISSMPAKPVVSTAVPTNITTNSASSGGIVTTDGGGTVSLRGVCWNISGNPTISNWHTTDGSGIGYYYSSLGGLTPNTTYYVRAYATNEAGTAYGEELSFKTKDVSGLNGLWTTGSIVVSIDESTGAFYQILSGMWLQALGAGYINIGSTKIANINMVSPSTWSCRELWWHSTDGIIDGVAFSPDGSIVMYQDGNTFEITSSNPWTGGPASTIYTRVGNLMTVPVRMPAEKPGAVFGK